MQTAVLGLRPSLRKWSLVLLLSVLLSVHLQAAAVVLLGVVSHVAIGGSAVLAPPDGEVSHIPHSGLGGDVELMNV